MSRRKPLDPDLYATVVAEAQARFAVWPSAYASGWVVRTYKQRGGRYAGEARGEDTGLTKWFGEEWVDLSRPIYDESGTLVGYEPCGRRTAQDASKDPAAYPKCRPLAEAMRMSPSDVKDAIKRKRMAEAKAAKGRGGRGARAPVRVATYRANPIRPSDDLSRWAAKTKRFDLDRCVKIGSYAEYDLCFIPETRSAYLAEQFVGEACAIHRPTGEVVGVVDVSDAGDGTLLADFETHPHHRRKKITTALFDAVENHLGATLRPSEPYSVEAEAFWKSRQVKRANPANAVFDWELPGTRGIREVTVDDVTILYGYNGESAHIASVRTKTKEQGKGKARRVMERFCEEADALGIPIKLEASPLTKKVNRARLVAFYESLGFEKTGRTINPVGDPEMVRLPARANPDVTSTPERIARVPPKYLSAVRGMIENPSNDVFYHTTSFASVDSIAANGLRPRRGAGVYSHGGYGEHSQGKVFLAGDKDAALAWYGKIKNMLWHEHSDDEEPDELVPVMLRIDLSGTTLQEEVDPLGDRDVPGSYFVTDVIPPDVIEFFDPSTREWTPVEEWSGDAYDGVESIEYFNDEGDVVEEDDTDEYGEQAWTSRGFTVYGPYDDGGFKPSMDADDW